MPALAAQTVECGGSGQVAGAVVEKLARKCARFAPAGGLARGQPGRCLDHAVEPSARGPGTLMAPRVHDHDNRSGVALGDLLRGKAEPVQGARPIAVHENIGLIEECVQALHPGWGGQVKCAAALAEQSVREGARCHVTPARRVDAEHVRSERGEQPGADRPGDDAGEVKDPRPYRRGPGWRVPGHVAGDEGFCADDPSLGVAAPSAERPDRGAGTARGEDPLLELLAPKRPDRRPDRIRGDLDVAGHLEGIQERPTVPRVVGVAADPPVGCRPKARQRGEGRSGRPAVHREEPLAAARIGHMAPV